jgi:hypothetical protein
MVRLLSSVSAVLACLCLVSPTITSAFSVAGPSSMASSFGGQVLVSGISNGACMIEMKMKGKAQVPQQMRGQYKKAQEMRQMRDQMLANSRPGPDGLPVFNLFVRTKKANVSKISWDKFHSSLRTAFQACQTVEDKLGKPPKNHYILQPSEHQPKDSK